MWLMANTANIYDIQITYFEAAFVMILGYTKINLSCLVILSKYYNLIY